MVSGCSLYGCFTAFPSLVCSGVCCPVGTPSVLPALSKCRRTTHQANGLSPGGRRFAVQCVVCGSGTMRLMLSLHLEDRGIVRAPRWR